ncbi:MAG: Stf0 family sulfotransferase [Microcoleaceae cyanobacterium]
MMTQQLTADKKEEIFQCISETKILDVLRKTTRPFVFIGDPETLSTLKIRLSRDNYSYIEWNEGLSDFRIDPKFLRPKSIIVISSIYDENHILDQIKAYFENNRPASKSSPKLLRLFSDILVNLLSRQAPFQPSEIELETPEVSYAIVTTPRSGSTFLCDLLQKSGLAGYPAEHLRRPVEVLSKYCQFDYIRYVKVLMARQTTPNKVFGTKLISHFLIRYLEAGLEFDSFFQDFFQKVIYLQRRDKVAQSVSLFLAKKTGIWHIFNDEMQELYNTRVDQIELEECQPEAVKSFYDSLTRQEEFIEAFLQRSGVLPLKIYYEDLVSCREKYLYDIYQYLGVVTGDDEADHGAGIKRTKSPLASQLIQKFKENYPSLS